MITLPVIAVIVFFLLILLFNMIKVLKEYERGVVFRLGRLIGAKGPGLIILIPILDKMVRVEQGCCKCLQLLRGDVSNCSDNSEVGPRTAGA